MSSGSYESYEEDEWESGSYYSTEPDAAAPSQPNANAINVALESSDFDSDPDHGDEAVVSAPPVEQPRAPPVVAAPVVSAPPPKNKVDISFEDSMDRPPRSLQDLQAMQDDFASDSDVVQQGLESERLVVRAKPLDDHRQGLVDFSSSADEDEFLGDLAGIASADKVRFMRLPEPLGKSTSLEPVEEMIDMLDYADPMLRITQSKIRGFRDYLRVVEKEEVVLLGQFREEIGQKAATEVGQIAEQESCRRYYESKLSDVRDRRARFRGLLYDSLEERRAIIRAHLQRHDLSRRDQEKLDYWRDRSGLDGWTIGFFVASVAILVCYVVFLTFPIDTSTSFRVVFPAGQGPFEFDYRMTILTSLFVVVGLSFWMAAAKRFQWSTLSLNLLLVSWSVVWGLLMHVFFEWAFVTGFRQVPLSPRLTTLALYSAASVLCAHAVLLGRINLTQGMVMATFQCLCFAVIVGFQRYYLVVDNGGAVSVWIFGGVFGLAASVMYALDGEHHKPMKPGHARQNGKRYNEELRDDAHPRRLSYASSPMAWIGCLILWVMWPVFNSALAPAASQGRVVAVTLTSLIFSTLTAIGLSEMLLGRRFGLRPFLNATLSGGVAMGSAASVLVPPWIAALVGIVCGIISTLGEWKLVAHFENHYKLYDAQGVLWNFVIPASLGFLVTAIVTAAGEGEVIWGLPYAEWLPSSNQAGFLAASWIIALAFAVLVGILTGFILRKLRQSPRKNQLWRDDNSFLMVGDYAAF